MQEVATAISLEQLECLRRVAASRTFEKAHRLRQLLLHLGEKAAAAHWEDLTEDRIASQVFGREVLGDDTIVRSSARQLRAKLREYYDNEGSADGWTIEIPKGRYVPSFSPAPAVPAAAEAVREASPIVEARTGRGWMLAALGAMAAAVALVSGLAQSSEPSVLELALSGSQAVTLIASDSSFTLANRLSRKQMGFAEYVDRKYIARHESTLTEPGDIDFWRYLNQRQTVNFTDMLLVNQILRRFPRIADRIRVVHPVQVHGRDLRDGDFIVLGSPYLNPVASIYQDSLEYVVEGDVGLRSRTNGELLPVRPRDRVYLGHLALLPNPVGTGRVLLIGGATVSAMEGTGEFATSSASVKAIGAALNVSGRTALPFFEAVLEVNSVQGSGGSAKVAKARVIRGR